MRNLHKLAAVGVIGALALAGCGSGKDDSSTVVVGASPSPHAVILEFIQKDLAKENGIKLDIVEYTDYVQPNEALNSGDLDANYYQTIPYLEDESEARGYDFVAGEGIHLEPLAVYSEKLTSLDELPAGAKVGIINDTTNQGRALQLLADNGLVEIPESGDVNVNTVTKLKDFEFVETEGPQLGRSLADVDVAVINGNFAQQAGLAPADSLVIEETEGNPALNVLVWSPDTNKAEAVATLEKLLHSAEVQEFIETQWPDGSVLPAK